MASSSYSVSFEGEYSLEAVQAAALSLRTRLQGPATVAFVFATPDYLPHLDDFIDTIRVDGHVSELVGCTAGGLISGGTERESGSGFTLLGLRSPGTTVQIVDLTADRVEQANPQSWRAGHESAESWLVFTNPFLVSADDWLGQWEAAFPGVPVVGGLASGGTDESQVAVFHNSRTISGGVAVGFSGSLKVVAAVSQGCRPIGEALPVTKAEDNIIFSLGSRPAFDALETAFESLTEAERSHAQGNLFAGLANNEYVEEFRSGDFVIRNIIGADPKSGAVVIGGTPRVGQTMQYQLRDSAAADADLRRVLEAVPGRKAAPVASLIFTCLGRGTQFFPEPNHDAALVQELLKRHHSVGFFGNGEIGPVGGRNCVHGYTASCAIFYDTTD